MSVGGRNRKWLGDAPNCDTYLLNGRSNVTKQTAEKLVMRRRLNGKVMRLESPWITFGYTATAAANITLPERHHI